MIKVCIFGGIGWRVMIWLEYVADTFDNLIGVVSLGMLQSSVGFRVFHWLRGRVL